MNRRSFIGTILTLAAAPAIVRASSLMPVRAPISGLDAWRDAMVEWQRDQIAAGSFRVSLHTGPPPAGIGYVDVTGVREVIFGGYARQKVTREQLNDYITFPQCTGGATLVSHIGVTDHVGQTRLFPIQSPVGVCSTDTLHVKLDEPGILELLR